MPLMKETPLCVICLINEADGYTVFNQDLSIEVGKICTLCATKNGLVNPPRKGKNNGRKEMSKAWALEIKCKYYGCLQLIGIQDITIVEDSPFFFFRCKECKSLQVIPRELVTQNQEVFDTL